MAAGATATVPAETVRAEPTTTADRLSRLVRMDTAGTEPTVEADEAAAEPADDGGFDRFEHVPDAVAVADPESGDIVYATDRYVELVGHDREAIRDRGFDGLAAAPNDDVRTPLSGIDAVANGQGPTTVEWQVETADGERRWLAATVGETTIDGERRLVSVERDVTARRADRPERDRVMAASQTATTFHDPETGAIIDASSGFAESLGYPDRDSALAAGLEAVEPRGESATLASLCETIQRIGEQATMESMDWTTVDSDGTPLRFRVFLSPGVLKDRRCVICQWTDVTEKWRLERTYRDVFENVSDGLVVHEPDSGEIVEVNGRFCEMMGYEREELVGESVGVITADAQGYSFERARSLIGRAEDRGPQLFEWRNEHADGHTFPVDVHLSLVEIRGTDRVLASVRDITERKQREREYEQVFDGVNDAITVHDPWDETMIDANETLCELVGYDRETVLEGGIESISVGDQGFTEERAYEIQREVAETGEPRTAEWRVESADGERRVLETNITPATIGGERRVLVLSRDVTERRRRSRQLELIVDRIDEAVALSETATTVGEPEYVSPAIADIFGLPYDRLVDDTTILRERIHEADRQEYEAGFASMVADVERGVPDDRYDFEFRYDHPDGETRWIHLMSYPMPDIEGYGRVAVFEDVTERKRREREYEQIFNAVIDGITVHDPDTGEIIDANEAMSDLVGYDCEEIVGMDIETLSPADEGFTNERGQEIIDRVMERGEPEVVDWAAETAAGETRWLEVRATPAVIGGEERYLAIDRDITERREREEELRRTQRQFRQISEAVDEVIHLASAGLSETYYLSPSYEDIWGRPVEEMYEDPSAFMETLHPDDRAEFLEFLDEVTTELTDPSRDEGDQYSYDYRVQRDDGEVRWISGRIYPIRDDGGEVIRLVSVSRDITETKQRRETLESFQAATAELTTVGSSEEACRIAVDAASDVFDLQAVAVHSYDQGSGRLTPTAATANLGETAEIPTWSAKDAVPWEAFVDDRVVRADVVDDPTFTFGPGGQIVVMPLSGHGVMTVWADDEAPVETAHLIAATLEGALNHIVGERRLESQQAELEAQTERADQLERVAELNRRVEAAITDQSTRVGVERAVCERLVEIESFAHAWVAEDGGGGGALEPRATVGLSRETVQQWLHADAGTDKDVHPAVTAWRTDEVTVEDDLVGASGSGWRRDLLRRGVQTVCALPLSYEGIVHGVLVVHATTPGAFGGRAREALDQLGSSIGYAVTAIDRRRALESDETFELEFRDDGTSLPFARLAEATGCQVRHDRTVRRQDGSVRVVYRILGGVPSDVTATVAESLTGETEVLSNEGSQAIVERTGATWFGSIISEYGGVLRRGHATPDRTTIVVELPTEANTRRFVERLEETIPGVELHAQRQQAATSPVPGELAERVDQHLSPRQKEALETALRLGYFDWPREHSGEEVANEMDITQPTLNKHLRVGERKVLETVLDAVGS
jgi:PAS domain S-box-containing protein